MASLCGVWWCSNTIFRANLFPKLKKSSSCIIIMVSSDSKEEVIYVRDHSHGIARNKSYGAITKRMKFNCPVVETSESIKPNDNNLELNAIAHAFSKTFQPELKQFLRQSWTLCTRLFGFPSETNEATEKKNNFSAMEDFTLLRFRNKKTRRQGETKGPNRQQSKTLLESIVKTLSSVGRAPVCCSGDRRFEPQTGPILTVLK